MLSSCNQEENNVQSALKEMWKLTFFVIKSHEKTKINNELTTYRSTTNASRLLAKNNRALKALSIFYLDLNVL